MQVFNMKAYNKRFLKGLYLLIVSMILLFWLEQRSINAYWIQTYHQNSPLSLLDNNKLWQVGARITEFLSDKLSSGQATITEFNNDILEHFNEDIVVNTNDGVEGTGAVKTNHVLTLNMALVYNRHVLYIFPHQPFIRVTLKNTAEKNALPFYKKLLHTDRSNIAPLIIGDQDLRLFIAKGQKVFFVGDSLMQGVAPHTMRALLKDHGIESINLSKQSTGLSYPRFYDWPQVVRDTFAKNNNIKLMVVFMGPNDPWDFPVVKGKRFFKLGSPEWEGAYRARIQQLINTAVGNGAEVLWIGAPNVKSDKLNNGMLLLDRIYKSQVTINQQYYIPSNDLLGMKDDVFVKFMKIPNKGNITLRTDDGIHFTVFGQKRIADKIMSLLHFNDAAEEVTK